MNIIKKPRKGVKRLMGYEARIEKLEKDVDNLKKRVKKLEES